jgi:hypothetical protein
VRTIYSKYNLFKHYTSWVNFNIIFEMASRVVNPNFKRIWLTNAREVSSRTADGLHSELHKQMWINTRRSRMISLYAGMAYNVSNVCCDVLVSFMRNGPPTASTHALTRLN